MKLKISHYIFISLTITALLIPAAIYSLNSMVLDTSIHQVMGTDSRTKDTYDKFNRAFQDNVAVMAIVKIDDLFSDSGAALLYEISSTFQQIPGLTDIKSLTHSARPVKGELSVDPRKILKFKTFIDLNPKSTDEWQKIKAFVTEYPMTRDILVSADGRYAMIIAIIDGDISTIQQKKDLLKLCENKIKPFVDRGIEINLLSEPFLSAEFHDLVKEFELKFFIISFILLGITIIITFRSLTILILMLNYQIAGFLVFPPIFYFNITSTNVFTFIVIPLISALHLTFLAHFFSVFQHEIKKDDKLKPALKRTLKIVLKPSVIAAITSGIGLATLLLSDIPVLRTVGTIGLEALAGIFAITFIPAILLSLGKTPQNEEAENEAKEENKTLQIIDSIKLPATILSTLFVAAVIFKADTVETDVRIKEFLVKESKTRASLNLLDEHFGGINILQLEVRTDKENGIQNYEVIEYLHNLRNKAMNLDGVLNAYTYSQFYTTIHQLFLGDDLSTGNVLPSKSKTLFYSMVINSIHFPFQDILQSEDRKSTVFFLRTRDLPTKDFLKVVEEFSEVAKEDTPDGVEVRVQDGIHTILKSNQQIVETQIQSLSTGLIAIFLCLLFMWRSPKLAATALLCNLIPISCIGALMLLFSIPVNSITAMAGSIILGISVDDSIHFLSYFKSLPTSLSQRERVSMTLYRKLRPMICTSFILVICLLLLLMAPFTPMRDFGFLGGIALLGGLFSSCLLLPGLLLFKKDTKNSNKDA